MLLDITVIYLYYLNYYYAFVRGYFYSASSSPIILRGSPEYSIDTLPGLTRRSAIANCE